MFCRPCAQNSAPGLLKVGLKLGNNDDVTIWQNDVIFKGFWLCPVSYVMFGYWSEVYFSIITGCEIRIIFV